jgi:hypothetical protein
VGRGIIQMSLSTRRFVAAALLALTMAGCSPRDPASEERVDPLDGQYEVNIEAGGAVGALVPKNSNSEPLRSVCVRNGSGATFAAAVPLAGALHPGCTHSPAPRQGNALSGRFTCPLDQRMAPGGQAVSDYQGAVSEQGVEIDLTTRMIIPESAYAAMPPEQAAQIRQSIALMESIPMRVVAQRTGDCTS